MKNQKILLTIGLICFIVILAVATFFVSSRVSSQKSVAPTAPTSQPKAAEVDATTVAAVSECGTCNSTLSCANGLTCDDVDGKCKKNDGSSVCWSAFSTACRLDAVAPCVPTDVITCNPDCPTECGLGASVITSCKDSCGAAKTKSCLPTLACGLPNLTIVKEAYKNESTNTDGVYDLKTKIDKVAKNDIFVYTLSIENIGSASANAVLTDALTGENQDLLTFVDADEGCAYVASNDTVTCSGITLAVGAKTQRAFRVRVGSGAVNGDMIKNIGKVKYGLITKEAKKDLTIDTPCVPTDVITCTPDCPTVCGKAASTITTCKDSCGAAKTKSCPATEACGVLDISITKKAFSNDTANTAGNYTLTTEISKVSKNQTFVYSIYLKNTSTVAATKDVYIKDALEGIGQDELTFIDTDTSKCSYVSATRTILCENISLAADQEKIFSFRVKVSSGAVNGETIKNKATVWFPTGKSKDAEKTLNISTVVACNNTCTTDDECSGDLVCDTTSNKCRASGCLNTVSCVCPTATIAPTVALAKCNRACEADSDCISGLICDTASGMCRKEACADRTNCTCLAATAEPTVEPTARPTTLPEAGILDYPGIAAFGGGLLLAIVGILLAL